MSSRISVGITGMGCLCGAGGTLKECMDTLFQGKRSPQPPSRFASTHTVPYPVFEVPEASIPDHIKDSAHISFTGKLALVAAYEALEDAGFERVALKGKKIGVCVGTTVGSMMNNEMFYREFSRGNNPEMGPIVRFLRSNPAALIARELDLAGPCQTVVNACSSGTDAVGIGTSWIQSGACDMVIAGGTDELSHVTYNGFISLMITDETACKPFDRYRKGLNLGEGAAMLILEPESVSRKRWKPRARILGYASSSDAYHLTAPHPQGEGLKRALIDALRLSNRSAKDIAFVNAHGTATPDNDRAEARVLHEILPDIPFLSTKGFTGHTLGAAGAIEAAFTVACLERGSIPCNAGFTTADPDLPATPVDRETIIHGKSAISESLAFGGLNGVLVLETGEGL